MIQKLIKRFFKTNSEKAIKILLPLVEKINELTRTLENKTDDELVQRTEEFRQLLIEVRVAATKFAEENINHKENRTKYIIKAEQDKLEEILPEAFAMVKEICRRLVGTTWRVADVNLKWEMIPYDVQIIGGIILHRSNITEMKTGEGKTLVAAFPIYLNALTGRGVHLITVNDYLARRDAEWMGQIYVRLGLKVGFILNTMNNEQRRDNYNCDITYGTNNEFGFDYLRDNMSLEAQDQVQRGHAFAIVDEVDSVLIDEARTPLIISGSVDAPVDTSFQELRPQIQQLVKKQGALVSALVSETKKLMQAGKDSEAGLNLLQASRGLPKHPRVLKIFQEPGTKKLAHQVESEYLRDKKLHEVDDDLYFSIDEKTHVIDITEKGREFLAPNNPETFIIPDLGELLHEIDENENLTSDEKVQEKEKAHRLHADRSGKIHNLTQLLRAHTMYEKDVDYVIQNDKVMIVDEFTGRVLAGRRYSDGLHQALEAKENLTVERETQTLATITIQNYFRMYDKLSGMTGTAETEAEEFGNIYNLDVLVIPPNEPVIRLDRNDLVYKTKREKYNAVVEEITACFKKGQPTLVGTITVEASELLSRMLKRQGIPHNVLNAKQHAREAEIVMHAGQRGGVTIATNMAGRGTDIKLGEGIKELGGLHIIGTERHESRRIDLQLRGRSGRQGDPGSSIFYLSLEDDLMRLFNSERIASIMDRLGVEEGEVITAGMVTRAIENAQKKVEQRNYGIRKHLLEYDNVMNQQRQIVYDIRGQALHGDDVSVTVMEMLEDFIEDELNIQGDEEPLNWDWEGLKQTMSTHILVNADLEIISRGKIISDITKEDISKNLLTQAEEIYKSRESLLPEKVMRGFERFVILRSLDEKWKDHLYAMDQLREGINLRAYGQKDPLLEYKSEGFSLFQEMMAALNSSTIQRLFRTQIQGFEETPSMTLRKDRNVSLQHDETTGMGFSQSSPGPNRPQQAAGVPVQAGEKHGRNEKITVTSPSGKKIQIKYKKLENYLKQGFKVAQ